MAQSDTKALKEGPNKSPFDTPPQATGSASVDFILISGLSGAGHTTVLRAFEDNGFVAIDNLPLQFLLPLSDLYTVPVAVSIDTRTLDFSPDTFLHTIKALKSKRPTARFIFLECEESVILTRYKYTRRPHPFRGKDVQTALREEFDFLRPLRILADEIFDTSYCSSEQTTLWVREQFCTLSTKLIIQLVSFSYRQGIPPQADIVLDARFLKNPFYEFHLNPLTGRDQAVQRYLELDPSWEGYLEACLHLIQCSLSGFKLRGRSYVTIAAGCTGGRHRSVFLIETLSKLLQDEGAVLGLRHRELD